MGDLDAVFRALADERRRRVLRCLERHHAVPLADLAEQIAEATVRDADGIADIPGERVKDVYMTLYHTDLPVLEEAGLIEYEQSDDVVTRSADGRSVLRRGRDEVEGILDGG